MFAQFLPEIRSRCDAVINITTGGGHGMSLDERTAAARRFSPELCSLNMGSMNFAIFGMAAGIKEFKHDWEPQYLEMTRDYIFRNTFQDIETILATMSEHGHPLRVRVLRRRPALHARALPRARPREAAAVRAVRSSASSAASARTSRTSCT